MKEIVCCKDSVVWSIVVLISSQEGFGEGIWMEVPSAHTDSVPLTLDGAVCREEVAYPCRIRSQRPVYVYLPPPPPPVVFVVMQVEQLHVQICNIL